MTQDSVTPRYKPGMIALHWLIALLILSAYMATFVWDFFPKEERGPVRDFHKFVGTITLVLVIARIIIRVRSPAMPPGNPNSAALELLSRLAHAALYILMLVVVFAGTGMTVLRGAPFSLWGVELLPALVEPVSKDVLSAIKEVHENAANMLIALSIFHIIAALWHQFIKRDNLMYRMSFKK